MRYCLIGCGRVSANHIQAALANRLEICGLCEITPSHIAENLAGHKAVLQDVPVYTDYREMLKEAQPELVAIATPSGYHAEEAVDCLYAGASVIIEKPIAMTLESAEAIRKAAEESGKTVAVNFQNRFNPAVRELHKAIEQGRFGQILSLSLKLRWYRDEAYYASAEWRGTKQLDGGVMMNQAIHGIDLLNWMSGSEPVKAAAIRKTLLRPIESEDTAMCAVEYQNGALGNLECTTLMYPQAEEEIIEVIGTKGFVRLGGIAAHVIEHWLFDDSEPEEEARMRLSYGKNPTSVYGHGHSALYADVLEAIARGRRPLTDWKTGRDAVALIQACYRSSDTGCAVMV
ncbi:MAG: Gfo/Idh/MocA family oxidoreductase [Oscillospiraceae bacterium]|jgi:predicted dehydrogenase|nr:Gfo/Idh/MocA family oxidoreductase [Oscillospiraceae bacterium]